MSREAELRQALASQIHHLPIVPPIAPLIHYIELLYRWNKAYNLTAITDPLLMVTRHLLDSLIIGQWLQGPRILDVGTGAGLPGIPLAIAYPHYQFTLLDANGKKTRFLEEVRRTLSLKNVEVIQNRVEAYHPTTSFDTVCSRALSTLNQFTDWSHHLLKKGSIWLAMKGHLSEEELHAIQYPYKVISYSVPNISGERCCVIIEKE